MISRRDLLIAGTLTSASPALLANPFFEAGKQYLLVNPLQPTPVNTIEVIDFFAYTCPHCLRFAPIFSTWKKAQGNAITVRMCPVPRDERYLPFTKTYFALEALNKLEALHMVFFRAVIEQTAPFSVSTAAKDIENFMFKQGISRSEWEGAYNSFMVDGLSMQASKLWRAYNIDATPRVGIAGRFVTGPDLVGRLQETPACLDYLVNLTRQTEGKKPLPPFKA